MSGLRSWTGREFVRRGPAAAEVLSSHNWWVLAAARKWKRQLSAESAECCRTRDASSRTSREAPARTTTGEPRMPVWTWRAVGLIASSVCLATSSATYQEALLAQRDRATRCVSQNLVNCRNKLYNKSRRNRMELEGYRWPTCSEQPRLVDCPIGVVNKLDRRRRVLLTTRSPCCGEIPEFGANSHREVP